MQNRKIIDILFVRNVTTFLLMLLFVIVPLFYSLFLYENKNISNRKEKVLSNYIFLIKNSLIIGDVWEAKKVFRKVIEDDTFRYIAVQSNPDNNNLIFYPYLPKSLRDGSIKPLKYVKTVLTDESINKRWEIIGYYSGSEIKNHIYLFIVITVLFLLFFILITYINSRAFARDYIAFSNVIGNNNYEENVDSNISKEAYELLEELKNSFKINKEEKLKNQILISKTEKFNVSRQIAHDIRSPLEALKSVTNHINELDYTTKQILNNSIGRISDIASGLLKTGKENDDGQTIGNFRILIDDIINDKKFEHNIKIHYKSSIDYQESFINGNENDLYRAVSNLVNNAYESQEPDKVRIEIELNKFQNKIKFSVKDFGVGMPADLIEKALIGGTTTKEKGNGLGLSFSKKMIEKHGGSFSIESYENFGTQITLLLPTVNTPKWFTDVIEINSESSEVVCVDDDPSFLELYKDKLKNIGIPVITYSEKTIEQARLNPTSQYYFDYDLGNNKTGLDFIIKNNLSNRSTLVTSMHQDVDIQSICIEHGIRILPKQIFNNSLVVTGKVEDKSVLNKGSKVVFIDDDNLMHMSWKMEADRSEVKLDCFYTIEEFIKVAEEYPKDTKIFIDSNLADGIKGEIESERIADLGFSELYLATGYSASDIDKPDWIKEIVGKRASFDW